MKSDAFSPGPFPASSLPRRRCGEEGERTDMEGKNKSASASRNVELDVCEEQVAGRSARSVCRVPVSSTRSSESANMQ